MSPGAERDIRLVGVAHSYTTDSRDVIEALAPTDLTIPAGQFVSLVGPSGCGKSTLLRVLAGFILPTQGEARVGEEPIAGPGVDRGVVFQASTLFPWYTVRQNVELGLRYRRVPAARRHEIAAQFLELVGLSDVGNLRPGELSGGMQQRCQIARVLANHPGVVLMDEPFGALDALTRAKLQRDLRGIHRERRSTVLFITHSVDEAVFLSDRVLVMSRRPGRIVLDRAVALPDRDNDEHATSRPDFVALRDEIAAAIEEQ